ncbi:MAG: hypothetical protein JWO91_2115, partial [Acidobacteriaceae bacterium]|nr:hypothetical protein [Acidobacteriaceae bacterium]
MLPDYSNFVHRAFFTLPTRLSIGARATVGCGESDNYGSDCHASV